MSIGDIMDYGRLGDDANGSTRESLIKTSRTNGDVAKFARSFVSVSQVILWDICQIPVDLVLSFLLISSGL